MQSAAVSQGVVGTVDVKTKRVHFYVQRNTSFSAVGKIPFDYAQLNEGNGFNLASGYFIAPVSGNHHFQFSAVKSNAATSLMIFLFVNHHIVGVTWTSQSTTGSLEVVSLTASLRLVAGDKVSLYKHSGDALFDYSYHTTHFTGWLVEEDLP